MYQLSPVSLSLSLSPTLSLTHTLPRALSLTGLYFTHVLWWLFPEQLICSRTHHFPLCRSDSVEKPLGISHLAFWDCQNQTELFKTQGEKSQVMTIYLPWLVQGGITTLGDRREINTGRKFTAFRGKKCVGTVFAVGCNSHLPLLMAIYLDKHCRAASKQSVACYWRSRWQWSDLIGPSRTLPLFRGASFFQHWLLQLFSHINMYNKTGVWKIPFQFQVIAAQWCLFSF